MHNYLRTIGFSHQFATEHQIDLFLDDVFQTCSQKIAVKDQERGTVFLEMSKSFGPNIGVRLFGEMDDYGFHRQGYYPYLLGTGTTSQADLTIEKKISGDGYTGMCDDPRVGISLIFFLQNPADFYRITSQKKMNTGRITTALSALALSGTILLPKKGRAESSALVKEALKEKEALIHQAREGKEEAIESLTLEDMDTYAMISRRILREDILTIVDSYVMPYGIECDQYQILGTILFFSRVYNSLTQETLVQMTLEVNDMQFDLCINEKDLLGEPEIGRRFKGNIWLQGKIACSGLD